MLTEFQARQVPGDYRRRWFTDDYFDLYVWYEADDTLHGFQLCYDKPAAERAITWIREDGCWHSGVDSGDSGSFSNLTPILVSNAGLVPAKVLREFLGRGTNLPDDVREMVITKVISYSAHSALRRPGTSE